MRRTGGAPASATGFLEKKFRNTTPSDLDRAMPFVIVLIHVSALRRVGLHAPHRRGAGERHRFLGKKVPKHDSIRSKGIFFASGTRRSLDKNTNPAHTEGGIKPDSLIPTAFQGWPIWAGGRCQIEPDEDGGGLILG